MALVGIEAGGFGIEDDLAHDLYPVPSTSHAVITREGG
jgi:hypothetical protein